MSSSHRFSLAKQPGRTSALQQPGRHYGITAFRGSTPTSPARLLSFVVRPQEGVRVGVREGTDEALIAAINAAPRAMVFLTVPWSCPERTARADFRKAVTRLAEIGLPIEAFAVDEESDVGQRWLASLGLLVTFEGVGVPQGWGAVLWLEYGRLVWRVGRGIDERVVGMITRSKVLWHQRHAEQNVAPDPAGI